MSPPDSPLNKHRILVARPGAAGRALVSMIEDAGGQGIFFPGIEITALENYGEVDSTIHRLLFDAPQATRSGGATGTWVIAVSRFAADVFVSRLKLIAKAAKMQPSWDMVRFAAVGPATAGVLQSAAIRVDVLPKHSAGSEGLLDALQEHMHEGDTAIILRAQEGRELLADRLRKRGVAVSYLACYYRLPTGRSPALLRQEIESGLDCMVITSASMLDALIELIPRDLLQSFRKIRVITISSRLADIAREKGFSNVKVSAGADNDCICATLALELSNHTRPLQS